MEGTLRNFGEIISIVGNLREISFKTAELTDETVIVGISHLPFAVAVGWGCADNVVDAHRNAQRGVTEAMGSGGLPAYVVTSDGCLLGLNAEKETTAPAAAAAKDSPERISRLSGVSLRYINRIAALMSERREDSLSAEELAEARELTPRSALRILDKLSDCGLAAVQYSRPLNRPGRPAKRYRIRFEGM